MSSGLLALLDDVAGIAKVAAASVDDVTGLAGKAGAKSAGLVIDDAAVTPRYVVGFAASRELPIIAKITRGSLRNKLLILLPAALVLSLFAPWAITPLLMLGGLFLCYEGAEKVLEKLHLHGHHDEPAGGEAEEAVGTPKEMEEKRVAGAIQTDFILSAEIMAVTLSTVPDAPFAQQAMVLALVGVGITLLVYGAVALIVKADDVGMALAEREGAPGIVRAFGRGMVRAMPILLAVLATVGTAAMLWVGGGIVIHGLEVLGLGGPAHLIHDVAAAVGNSIPGGFAGFATWFTGALMNAVIGIVLGILTIPVVSHVLAPAVSMLGRLRAR